MNRMESGFGDRCEFHPVYPAILSKERAERDNAAANHDGVPLFYIPSGLETVQTANLPFEMSCVFQRFIDAFPSVAGWRRTCGD